MNRQKREDEMTELDEQIALLEKKIDDLREPMQAKHVEWVNEAASWAASFWPEQAKAVVTAHPEIAKEAGVEGLCTLKEDVAALVNDANSAAHADLYEIPAQLWPHVQDDFGKPPHSSGGSIFHSHVSDLRTSSPYRTSPQFERPKFVEENTRRLLVRVAAVLKTHGFPVTRHADHSYSLSPGYDYYHHAWTQPMFDLLQEYAVMHEEAMQAYEDLEAARRKREESDAENLWDIA